MRKLIVVVGEVVGREPPGTRWIADPLAALGFLGNARLLVLVVGGTFDADEATLLARAARRRSPDLPVVCVGAPIAEATQFADVSAAVAFAETAGGRHDGALDWEFPSSWTAPRVRQWHERVQSGRYDELLGVPSDAPPALVASRAEAVRIGLAALRSWTAQHPDLLVAADEIEGNLRDALDVFASSEAMALYASARPRAEDV